MDEEKVIREEAQEFYENSSIGNHTSDMNDKLRTLKSRLYDFYSPEFKAIFLDELEKVISVELLEHRNTRHSGIAEPNCSYEKAAEKMLFYIHQEIVILPTVVRQKFEPKNNSRKKVFISYSHSDKEYLIDIQRHFKPFLNQIDYWDDNKIEPGQKWKDEIKKAINETKVAILIMSTDFLGSDFISTDELPPLLKAAEKDGAVILTIIVKPCLFEEFSELNQYQAMNNPNLPVSKMDINEREELFVNLVRQTKKILEK